MTSRISGKNFPLLKEKKKKKKWRVLFTACYSVMSLSWFLHSQQNPAPLDRGSCFAGKLFYHFFPPFLWSQWPRLPLVVPRQQIMSPAPSCLLHSSLLHSQHQDFERIMCGFLWYYSGLFPLNPIGFIFHIRVCLPRMFLQNRKLFTSQSFHFFLKHC